MRFEHFFGPMTVAGGIRNKDWKEVKEPVGEPWFLFRGLLKKIMRKEYDMKKAFYVASILLMVVLGLTLTAGAQEKISLRLGHIRDTNHPTHMATLRFRDMVSQLSAGRMEVKIFPNSQLGAPKEMFAQMQTGDLEMVYGGINTFAWINGGEPYEITAIPFLFRDYAHMSKALLSDFFKPIQEKAEQETKIKIITINGDTAPRGLSTKDKPIYKADDFKGLKIRTAASPTVLAAMKALGALPQQVAFSELYMALKTGIVDAQENGAIVVQSASLFEVQKYYMKTDYIRDIETFYMAMPLWKKLSKKDQEMIFDAAEKSGNYETQLTQKDLTTVYDFLKTKMTVVTPPQLDLESIRKKLDGAFDSFEGTKWPAGLLKKVSDLK
jgi:tripartite ATP-independent transporter DctP family solute receptor